MNCRFGHQTCSLVAGLLVAAACGSSPEVSAGAALTAADSTAIRQLHDRYVAAWLADDTSGVLALFEPDAVILPPGHQPVSGRDSIRGYWWPTDGSVTRISSFTWMLQELQGTPELAFTRGESALGWSYTKAGATSRSTSRSVSLTVLRRVAPGEWRIARQMWGPPLTR